MNDYGVFSTIAAATTLAALLFLVFIVIRTLSPKPKPPKLPSSEKKKKKKKGISRKRDHHHHHHHPQQQQQQQYGTSFSLLSSSSSDRIIKTLETSLSTGDDIGSQMVSDHMTGNPSNRPKFSVPYTMDNMTPISEVKPSLDYYNGPALDSSLALPLVTVAENTAEVVISTSILPETKTGTKSEPSQIISSTSTVETSTLSDDQSCESTSIHSFPSVGAISSTRSGEENKKNNKSTTTPRRSKRASGRLSNTPDADGRHSGKQKSSGGAVTVPHHNISSRWDALKPEPGHANVAGGNTKVTNRYQQSHQQQLPHAKTRWYGDVGRGGTGGGDKKGLSRHAPSGKRITPPTTYPQKPRSNKAFGRSTKPLSDLSPNAHGTVTAVVVMPESPLTSNFISPPPPGFQNDTTQHESNTSVVVTSPWEGLPAVGSSESKMTIPRDQDVVTALLHMPIGQGECTNWNDADHGLFSAPTAALMPASHVPFGEGMTTKAKENPFIDNNTFQTDLDSQIEADLQELGGQMAGSILDF
jgi:hypothetical protein